MIPIKDLTKEDIGRRVRYLANHGAIEWGRLKSWNPVFIFVVYGWAGEQEDFKNYTGASTRPEQLEWDMQLPSEVKKAWIKKIQAMSREDLAILQRYAPNEFEVYRNYDLWKRLTEMFVISGGMTAEISKTIGELQSHQVREKLAVLMARPE